VTSVVLVLTVANSFAPKAAAGGHGYLFLYNLTINMIIAGVLMLAVPVAAGSIFNSILNQTG
jgi:archaellum biogenesis protein FlaJ (TadC family)